MSGFKKQVSVTDRQTDEQASIHRITICYEGYISG